MPVELNLVESVTELDTTVVTVVLESASEPGPAGADGAPGVGVPAGGTTGQRLQKASNTDFDTEWADATSATVAAEDVTFDPAGNLAATDVQAALEELDTEKAATTHAHAGEDITSGTVADARIASTIARDTEVTAAISAHEADTTNVHGIADTSVLATDSEVATAVSDHNSDTTSVHGIADTSALALTANHPSNATFNDHSARHENGGADEISIAGLDGTSTELAAHLADTSDAHDASAISIADAGNDFTATDVEGALAELQADHETDAQNLTDHINDSSAAHAASAISVSSTTLSGTGTDAQAVFEELDNLLDDHSSRHENGGADEISVAGLSGELADAQPVAVHKNGTIVGTRSNINFIEGSNVTLTIADDAGDDEVDVTIAASGSGSTAVSFIPTFFAGG